VDPPESKPSSEMVGVLSFECHLPANYSTISKSELASIFIGPLSALANIEMPFLLLV
jgi:hypothetical protein